MPAERLSIAVSESCAQTIRELAKQNDTTVSAEIRKALNAYVNGMIVNKMEDAVVAAYNARIKSLEQRIKDKEELILAKNETIFALSEMLDISLKRENVVFTEDDEDISKNG
jgi:hypothetical protein